MCASSGAWALCARYCIFLVEAHQALIFTVETDFELRWFTPTIEVPLCGHATLASAKVLFEQKCSPAEKINFHTRESGVLTVSKMKLSKGEDKLEDMIFMKFPLCLPKPLVSLVWVSDLLLVQYTVCTRNSPCCLYFRHGHGRFLGLEVSGGSRLVSGLCWKVLLTRERNMVSSSGCCKMSPHTCWSCISFDLGMQLCHHLGIHLLFSFSVKICLTDTLSSSN